MKRPVLWLFAVNAPNGTHGTAPGAGQGSGGTSSSRSRSAVFAWNAASSPRPRLCDHVDPHRGDINKFWLGPFMSLCKRCHDSTKRLIERRGFRPDVAPDGWPTDQHHPVYGRKP